MTTTVLAYFPSPPRGVWHLGPVPIRAYALCIIIGIVVALLIGDRRWEARGGERGVIYDIALWAVPFGLVGGRLYHLATDWRTYFGEGGAGLGAAVRIWDGGLGIWGAVALGGIGAWIGCQRRGIPMPAFADAVAPGIVLAQAIGRLGNYFNQELFGRETTMPWGLEIFYRRDPAGFVGIQSLDGVSTGQIALVVQPTFLYELLWNVAVFVALIYLDRHFTIGHGRLFALYVAGYCFGRFCIELLRDDTATHIAGIRINSFTSTFVFIGAVVYLILAPKGREDRVTIGGEATEEPVPEPATELVAISSSSSAAATAKVDAAGGAADQAETMAVETSATGTPECDAAQAETEAETAAIDAPEVQVAAVPAGAVAEQPVAEEPEGNEPEADAVVPQPEESAAGFEEFEAEETEQREAATADADANAEAVVEEPEAEPPQAEKPEVAAAGEAAVSAGDEGQAAEDAVSYPAAELAGSTPMRWRSRLKRLNPRLRRRS
jgi:prolipoprotein diacylglyceryl transferase